MLHARTFDSNVYDAHLAYESRPSAPCLADSTVLKSSSPRWHEMPISISTSRLLNAHTIRCSKNASALRLLIRDAGNVEVSMPQVRRLPGFRKKRRWIALRRYNSMFLMLYGICITRRLHHPVPKRVRETNFRPTKTPSGDPPSAHLSQRTNHVSQQSSDCAQSDVWMSLAVMACSLRTR